MLENFAALERHPGSVAAIDGNTVVLAEGQRLDGIDVLLWGTGYGTDLSYIAVPRLAALRSVNELGTRCGCMFRSLNAANLYFPDVGWTGSAPRRGVLRSWRARSCRTSAERRGWTWSRLRTG